MDQREISQLIVNCSNAALPIEVRQVRINPKGRVARRTGSNSGSREDLNDAVGRQEAMVRVEIHGIIYIFNPPDLQRLEIEPTSPEQATQGQLGDPVDQAVPGTTNPQDPPAGTAEPAAPADPEPTEIPDETSAKDPVEDPVPKNNEVPADPAGAIEGKTDLPTEKTDTPEGS